MPVEKQSVILCHLYCSFIHFLSYFNIFVFGQPQIFSYILLWNPHLNSYRISIIHYLTSPSIIRFKRLNQKFIIISVFLCTCCFIYKNVISNFSNRFYLISIFYRKRSILYQFTKLIVRTIGFFVDIRYNHYGCTMHH